MSDKKGGKGKGRGAGEDAKGGGGEGTTVNGKHGEGGSTPGAASQDRCTSLINLDVKVLTQQLGADNEWMDRGDGRVEFVDFTIRVVGTKDATADELSNETTVVTPKPKEKGVTGTTQGSTDATDTTTVILEDTISTETPFVGENCCIVWNSFEQGLSMCLMYSSEEGYSASWSALVALQDKAYPPLHIDLLNNCLPPSERSSNAANEDTKAEDNEKEGTAAAAAAGTGSAQSTRAEDAAPMVPYSYYIHNKYDPPLGFIENHALSLCILEHNHAQRRELYENRDTVLALLNLANADLLELLLTKDVYALLSEGLGCALRGAEKQSARNRDPANGADDTTAGANKQDAPKEEDLPVPASLRGLTVPEELTAVISKDLRLQHLQQVVLQPVDEFTELLLKLSTISHRLRNELTCALLSSDVTLREAREALMIQPPATASAAAALRHRQSLDGSGGLGGGKPPSGRAGSLTNGHGTADGPNVSSAGGSSSAVIDSCVRAEHQVLAHLHFFRSLVSLSIAELGKELVGPVVVKVFQSGLLEALSLVAERFAMPQGAAQNFLSGLQDSNGGTSSNSSGSGIHRRGSVTIPNWYSPSVEAELTLLLDVTLVRLNERQEEQLMNELVRTPVLNDPVKYNGIVTFMLRQLALGVHAAAGAAAAAGGMSGSRATPDSFTSDAATALAPSLTSALSKNASLATMMLATMSAQSTRPRTLHEGLSTRNPYVLYHVLGLHDDEGSAAAERALDPESTDIRNRFHNLIITKYLFQASRGSLVPVPQPPSTGSGVTKGAPIIQFSNTNGPQSLSQGISPAFLRVLEYLVNLSTTENREALLKIIFSHKSHILNYVEGCCETASANSRSVGIDVLAGCIRFLRTIITQIVVKESEPSENPMALFAIPPEPISKTLVTTICRQLTVERDTFGIVLDTYHRIGGTRRNTVFHSAVLSILEFIDHHVPSTKEDFDADDLSQDNNDLRDIRDYIFLKHLSLLPTRYERKFREALLSEVSSRLGRDSYTPNDSVSVLSSTASEMLRSSSKLRFVDEVEAATGGVDGTVLPETVANLSPVVVGNVHSSEEKLSKKFRSAMDLLGTGGSGHLRNGGTSPAGNTSVKGGTPTSSPGPFRPTSPGNGSAGSPHFSPPTTVHISRPNGPLSPIPEPVGGAGTSPGGTRLKPVMPSTEKPAVRPRSGRASSELFGSEADAAAGRLDSASPMQRSSSGPATMGASSPSSAVLSGATSPAGSSGGSSGNGPPTTGTAGAGGGKQNNTSSSGSGGEALVLPKIRKRTAAVNGKR